MFNIRKKNKEEIENEEVNTLYDKISGENGSEEYEITTEDLKKVTELIMSDITKSSEKIEKKINTKNKQEIKITFGELEIEMKANKDLSYLTTNIFYIITLLKQEGLITPVPTNGDVYMGGGEVEEFVDPNIM